MKSTYSRYPFAWIRRADYHSSLLDNMNHKESHVNILILMIVPHQLSKNVNMKHSLNFFYACLK